MKKACWWCVPLVTLALVATGCSRSSNKSSNSNGSTATSSGGSAASGDFGDLKAVCGPGNAKGATEQGVTDSSIRVGTMADPGAQVRPGLDQELFDTADAFVGWCNAAGGIDGRKIQLDKWDSKLTEVAARMIEACQSDFMLVGNGEAFDSAGVDQRTKCRLGEIPGYVVSKEAQIAPMSVQPIPTSIYQSPLGGALRVLKQADAEVTKHWGLISSQLQSVKDAGDRDRAAAKVLGYTEAYYDEAPILVDNYRPYAQNLQSKGVQVFEYVNEPANLAALYKSLADVGYTPKYGLFNGNMYDQKLVQNGGAALKGTILISTAIVPFELASSHPATKEYIDILAKYANGAQPKSLGINGWSAWLLWAKSVKACGNDVTRDCVLKHAAATTDWTAGGVHAPTKPGNGTSPGNQCFVLIRATPTGFQVDKQITKPNNGIFNCDPANAFDLPGFAKS